MIIEKTNLEGVFEIQNNRFEDDRGIFVKTFHSDIFSSHGLDCDFKESFYSISHKDVLRGMHFQQPPHAHTKLVYVTAGEILDVVVDIRVGSLTYGESFSTTLSGNSSKSVYIPKGFAHGFLTLSKEATVVYLTTAVHEPSSDDGIHWDSFGFNWLCETPIVSKRDQSLTELSNL